MRTTSQLANAACIWEATARKVGNVHRFADYASTSLTDFLLSAAALQHAFEENRGVGLSIQRAVEATQELVGQNTNLGIILVLAPLVACDQSVPLRQGISEVLRSLTVEDAERTYHAIRLANPGGLGDAPEQDVHRSPTVTLLEAMKLAAERDQVARQYACDYAGIFDLGVPAFLDGFAQFGCVEAAIVACQLQWLAEFPDSLIARKRGVAIADDVRQRARMVQELGGIATAAGRRAGVALDRHLRSDGNKLNPGTTADLITACLFVALRENKIQPNAPFNWPVNDWL